MVSSGGELSVSGAVFLTIITASRLTGSSAVFGIFDRSGDRDDDRGGSVMKLSFERL